MSARFWGKLTDAFFPVTCLGCGCDHSGYFCLACRGSLCPKFSFVAGAELLTLGPYGGPLKACILAVKLRGQKEVGRELAELALENIQGYWDEDSVWIHAMASSRAGGRWRGFSLPEMIVKEVVQRTGWQRLSLDQSKAFQVQSKRSRGLGLEERMTRGLGSWPVHPVGQPKRVKKVAERLILVDDVVTTGATLAGAVGVARQLGYESVCCFALAVASCD